MKNKVCEGCTLVLPVASGAVAGDPMIVGQIPCVLVNDRQTDGTATVDTEGVFALSVAGIDSTGAQGADANVAVAVGDAIYCDLAKTPVLSKRAGGVLFGYALGTITSGSTKTINVKLKNG